MDRQRHSIRILLRGLISVALALACGSDDNGGPAFDDVLIPDTTKVLTTAELDRLDTVSADLGQLVFAGSDGALAKLEQGDVIVADVHGKLPSGMLRKITRVDRSGDKLTLTTMQAALTEAIERGSLKQTVTLDPTTVEKKGSALTVGGFSSKSYRIESDEKGFVFALNDVELYDADGDPATKGDRVSLDGNFSFAPTVSLEVDIDGFELKTLTFEIGSEQQASIRVTAGREATFAETRTLESIELPPISFSIGPVPVVIIPRIDLRIGVDGVVNAEVTAGIAADASVRVGFGYQNGSWSPIADLQPNASFDAPSFRDGAKGSARVWAGPRLEMAAYGVAGAYGELRGYIKGEIDSTANPWWELSAGVEAFAGIFIEAFDTTVADYETDLIDENVKLADAEGPAPSGDQKVITWARSFGGDNIDHAVAVLSTPDGGSLLVGASASFSASSTDLLLLKLDRLGQISWQRIFRDLVVGLAAAPHPDGGYYVVGGTVGTGADDLVVLRIDDNGDATWAHRLKASKEISSGAMVVRPSGVVIGGVAGGGTGADFWLTALDKTGGVQWSKTFGGDQGENINGLAALADGSLVAVGPTHSFGVSFFGSWAVKTDKDGKLIWQQSVDGDGNEILAEVVTDSAGNLFAAGHTMGDGLVVKLDPATGECLLGMVYDSGEPYDEAYHAVGTGDGGLLLAGKVGLGSQSDLWLLRLSPQLETMWMTGYGGSEFEAAGGTLQYAPVSTAIAPTADSGYVVISNSQSFGGNTFADIWVTKVSESGTITFDSGAAATTLSGSFSSRAISTAETTVTAADLAITSESVTLDPATPALVVNTQAAP